MHLSYIGPYFICTIRILYIQADIMHVFFDNKENILSIFRKTM